MHGKRNAHHVQSLSQAQAQLIFPSATDRWVGVLHYCTEEAIAIPLNLGDVVGCVIENYLLERVHYICHNKMRRSKLAACDHLNTGLRTVSRREKLEHQFILLFVQKRSDVEIERLCVFRLAE